MTVAIPAACPLGRVYYYSPKWNLSHWQNTNVSVIDGTVVNNAAVPNMTFDRITAISNVYMYVDAIIHCNAVNDDGVGFAAPSLGGIAYGMQTGATGPLQTRVVINRPGAQSILYTNFDGYNARVRIGILHEAGRLKQEGVINVPGTTLIFDFDDPLTNLSLVNHPRFMNKSLSASGVFKIHEFYYHAGTIAGDVGTSCQGTDYDPDAPIQQNAWGPAAEPKQHIPNRVSVTHPPRSIRSRKTGWYQGFFSFAPENGYKQSTLGTGFKYDVISESLAIDDERINTQHAGQRSTQIKRKNIPIVQGAVKFLPRTDDIIPQLMAFFQMRHGTSISGTANYTFVPNPKLQDLSGSSFGTGTYQADSGDLFSLRAAKKIFDYTGTNSIIMTGALVSRVTLDADDAGLSMESEYFCHDFRLDPATTETNLDNSKYSTKSPIGAQDISVLVNGTALDFVMAASLTLRNGIIPKGVVGGTSYEPAFGNYSAEGRVVFDLPKSAIEYVNQMVGGSTFDMELRYGTADHDKMIARVYGCRWRPFDVSYTDFLEAPFIAYAPTDDSVPFDIRVWTTNYSGTTFQSI